MMIENEKARESNDRDVLYALCDAEKGSFVFDESVTRIFNDMAHRSIPGYSDIQNFTAQYAMQYLDCAEKSKHTLYGVLDIGTSLGTSLERITRYADSKQLSLIHCNATACDNSTSMLAQARSNLRENEKKWHSIAYECIDIADLHTRTTLLRTYEKRDIELRVVILHFILQFTPIKLRRAILHDVWNAMPSQGVLIVGEKLLANDENSQHVWNTRYKNFKRNMGYSDREIEAKRKALLGVLHPMRENVFASLLHSLPNSTVDMFFAWAAFHAYAIHKA